MNVDKLLNVPVSILFIRIETKLWLKLKLKLHIVRRKREMFRHIVIPKILESFFHRMDDPILPSSYKPKIN